jgi:hypothetical protein
MTCPKCNTGTIVTRMPLLGAHIDTCIVAPNEITAAIKEAADPRQEHKPGVEEGQA